MASVFKKAKKNQAKSHSLFDKELKPEVEAENLSSSSSGDESVEEKKLDLPNLKDNKKEESENVYLYPIQHYQENELRAFKDQDPNSKEWKNRQRTLLIASRGVTSIQRHLLNDLQALLPHSKKEAKIERFIAKDNIDDLCFQRSCNNCIFFESRKRKDLFMWLLKSPDGPSFKFSVSNITTTDELKLTGNCLKYSRPLLSFDSSFDSLPHLTLAKEMLIHAFNTPKNHPKSKPFIDHVLSFKFLDDRIWFRNYQILNQQEEKFTEKDDIEKLTLIEIGPRFCMQPIKAFEGSLGGEPIWQNQQYISPSKVRSKKYDAFVKRRNQKAVRKQYKDKVWEEGQDPNGYLQDAFE